MFFWSVVTCFYRKNKQTYLCHLYSRKKIKSKKTFTEGEEWMGWDYGGGHNFYTVLFSPVNWILSVDKVSVFEWIMF